MDENWGVWVAGERGECFSLFSSWGISVRNNISTCISLVIV